MIVTEFRDKKGVFFAFVERTGSYRGLLKLVRLSDLSTTLREKAVVISYDAKFGPDVADIQDWGQQVHEWTKEIEGEQ